MKSSRHTIDDALRTKNDSINLLKKQLDDANLKIENLTTKITKHDTNNKNDNKSSEDLKLNKKYQKKHMKLLCEIIEKLQTLVIMTSMISIIIVLTPIIIKMIS